LNNTTYHVSDTIQLQYIYIFCIFV